jgi:hypothetical protein
MAGAVAGRLGGRKELRLLLVAFLTHIIEPSCF